MGGWKCDGVRADTERARGRHLGGSESRQAARPTSLIVANQTLGWLRAYSMKRFMPSAACEAPNGQAAEG